jgi:hypothetical protein
MIEACSFGSMVIDGKRYGSDLVIYPDGRVADAWRRKEGHRLSPQDISKLINSNPQVIVAGTGMSGQVHLDKTLEAYLTAKGIELVADATPSAVRRYNTMAKTRRVGACFHLTC